MRSSRVFSFISSSGGTTAVRDVNSPPFFFFVLRSASKAYICVLVLFRLFLIPRSWQLFLMLPITFLSDQLSSPKTDLAPLTSGSPRLQYHEQSSSFSSPYRIFPTMVQKRSIFFTYFKTRGRLLAVWRLPALISLHWLRGDSKEMSRARTQKKPVTLLLLSSYLISFLFHIARVFYPRGGNNEGKHSVFYKNCIWFFVSFNVQSEGLIDESNVKYWIHLSKNLLGKIQHFSLRILASILFLVFFSIFILHEYSAKQLTNFTQEYCEGFMEFVWKKGVKNNVNNSSRELGMWLYIYIYIVNSSPYLTVANTSRRFQTSREKNSRRLVGCWL